jgi:lipopolysaccharide transport system permease protein
VGLDATVVIEATPPGLWARCLALWRYRGFYGFLFREITMRKFRDTLLGFWWLILRPLLPTALFVIPFTFVQPLSTSGDLPYPLFFLSGFVTWTLFQSTLTFTPRTLLWMRSVMRRTYFPRVLVPLAGFGPPLIEVSVLLAIFALTTVAYRVRLGHVPLNLGAHTLLLVPAMMGALVLGISIGMVTSVIALFFRDVVFTMGYVTQIFMLLTPVVYPVHFVPDRYQWLLFTFNPMAELVETSRVALTGRGRIDPPFLAISLFTIGMVFVMSVIFFLRAETHLADEM